MGLLLLSFFVPFALLLAGFPPFLRFLTRRGNVLDDVHKSPPSRVPAPAGPILFIAALAGELVVAAGYRSPVPLAVLIGAAAAFGVGLWDDIYVLGGRTKPVLLLLAGLAFVAVVLVAPNLYSPALNFPVLGDTNPHFTIYTVLAVVAFPVVANAFNMMDAFNGEISWFTLLTSAALMIGAALHYATTAGFDLARVAATLPLVAVAAAFLVFNRYPSKAFDGDSGSLMFGAMFAGLAITSGVEVAAIIAIVPAILNSFYTLSSVRGFVERRKMTSRPTYLAEDGLLHASLEPGAPSTLVRLLLLDGPLSEKDLVTSIVYLTLLACLFSVAISVLTWVVLVEAGPRLHHRSGGLPPHSGRDLLLLRLRGPSGFDPPHPDGVHRAGSAEAGAHLRAGGAVVRRDDRDDEALRQVEDPDRSQAFILASNSPLVYLTRAGTPSTTFPGGTSFVTTAPMATTLRLPTVTPALITARAPITAPSSMVTPIILLLGG